MKRWRRNTMIACMFAALSVGGLYEAKTHVARGWLRGEAFYDGRPTSWWRCELDRWTARGLVNNNVITFGHPARLHLYSRRDSWIETRANQWFSRSPCADGELDAIVQRMCGPRLLRGDDDAAPVLRELLDDPSLRIRRFAQIGLKLKVEHSEDDE